MVPATDIGNCLPPQLTLLLVKQWSWKVQQPTFIVPNIAPLGNLQGQSFFVNTYPVPTQINPNPFLGKNNYTWTFSQVDQAQNAANNFAGQGQKNPQSLFDSHVMVQINGELDPSYGRVWAGLKAFRANAWMGRAYPSRESR